ALTGPFQHHITGDVGWAFWKFYQVTRDKEWLKERGYPMLKEVADFWISRVEKNESGGYDINNVIGANEYQENIDNNAYTNGMAKTVLGFATEAANELNIIPNPKWTEVAAGIPILKFKDGTTRENATYNGEIIKQADANLLAYPMKIVNKEEDIKKDLAYYEQKMDPVGPAMGFSTLATLYAKLGNTEKAYELFTQCYRPLEVPPFGVLAEFAGGTNPYFATGAGGNLQIILAGFAGLDITDDGITQTNSNKPKKWKKLTITGVGVEKKTFVIE
ncbi:MAG: glycoside hydrolase family 65 protein, partial [bacterium]|nr:glycoside hydrolase family 65 protein [bacterium]